MLVIWATGAGGGGLDAQTGVDCGDTNLIDHPSANAPLLELRDVEVSGRDTVEGGQVGLMIDRSDRGLPALVVESSIWFADFDEVPLEQFLERIGDASVVLLGEASHGSTPVQPLPTRTSAGPPDTYSFGL
jgi:hypothetical protein